MFDQKQKLANAIIIGKKGERIEPDTLRDHATNEILYKQADVLAEAQRYFKELNKPPAGIKTQEYLPEIAPREYPWAHLNALDGFQLETCIGGGHGNYINLDDHIRD